MCIFINFFRIKIRALNLLLYIGFRRENKHTQSNRVHRHRRHYYTSCLPLLSPAGGVMPKDVRVRWRNRLRRRSVLADDVFTPSRGPGGGRLRGSTAIPGRPPPRRGQSTRSDRIADRSRRTRDRHGLGFFRERRKQKSQRNPFFEGLVERAAGRF